MADCLEPGLACTEMAMVESGKARMQAGTAGICSWAPEVDDGAGFLGRAIAYLRIFFTCSSTKTTYFSFLLYRLPKPTYWCGNCYNRFLETVEVVTATRKPVPWLTGFAPIKMTSWRTLLSFTCSTLLVFNLVIVLPNKPPSRMSIIGIQNRLRLRRGFVISLVCHHK